MAREALRPGHALVLLFTCESRGWYFEGTLHSKQASIKLVCDCLVLISGIVIGGTHLQSQW